MPIRKNELIERRNAKIVKDYESLYQQGFRMEVCLEKLEQQYYITAATIYNIIWKAKTTSKSAKVQASR